MNDYPIIESSLNDRKDGDKALIHNTLIQDDISIRNFMKLLRENGMESEARVLDDMFENMNEMESQFQDMRQKISELETEVEQLKGDTPLTEQFKTEFYSRSTKIKLHLDELADRFLAAKDAFISAAREGIHKFAEVGKSALHRACASMSDGGIRYFNQVINRAQIGVDNDKSILSRLDELRESTKDMRQKRGNLIRSLFGRQPGQVPTLPEKPVLRMIRVSAESNLVVHDKTIKGAESIITKLESFRDRQLDAFQKNPSLDEMMKNAQAKAEQLHSSMKEKLKGHDRSGPVH